MDAKDLMIGDWIHVKGEREKPFSWEKSTLDADCMVEAIYTEPVSGLMLMGIKWWDNDGTWSSITCDEDEITPVPLTDEILKKNGFVLRLDSPYSKEFVLELPGEDDESDYFCVERNKKQDRTYIEFSPVDGKVRLDYFFTDYYVHQLQHALRLCNINKEIKL